MPSGNDSSRTCSSDRPPFRPWRPAAPGTGLHTGPAHPGRPQDWLELAEFAGHRAPDGPQRLLNRANCAADQVRSDLQSYVARHLGQADGMLVIDDTGFIKKGITSAGVQGQYPGTASRTEKCQIGVFVGYASATGRSLVNRELYLPKSWTDERDGCRAAKVPDERGFATKGQLARRLVLRALASELPIAWVPADAACGQEGRVRRLPEQSGVGRVLAVPSPSRSSVRASSTSSARLPAGRGSRSRAERVPRGLGSTTGRHWNGLTFPW
ncbi:transposase [Streptomyces virginiae]|uniref:IS701 family transposase n=1 Tax=Streptomyces virginiae TaxID=1961 RepID=UPI00368D4718